MREIRSKEIEEGQEVYLRTITSSHAKRWLHLLAGRNWKCELIFCKEKKRKEKEKRSKETQSERREDGLYLYLSRCANLS